MARYVDGFVIPIKKKNLKLYKKMANIGRKVWMKHGALDYFECVGDDVNVPYGTSFPKLTKLKKDEMVIFAYIVYKSKAHRNQVNKRVHSDPLMNPEKHPENIFDMKRMTVGGFKVLVHA